MPVAGHLAREAAERTVAGSEIVVIGSRIRRGALAPAGLLKFELSTGRRSCIDMGISSESRSASAYTVATLGFESPERRAIRGVLALSEQGEPIFRPFVAAPDITPDVIIVNADEPDALRLAMKLKQSKRHRNVVPVFVSRAPELAGARYLLCRPIFPAQLLLLLEQVAVEEHGYVPLDAASSVDRLIVLSAEEAVAVVMAGAARIVALGAGVTR
jgi:hypothetical protein